MPEYPCKAVSETRKLDPSYSMPEYPCKAVPETRKVDPSYSSYVRAPEDSEKHVVSRLDCSFYLLGGPRTYGAVVSE